MSANILSNAFTKKFGCKLPFILAPMGGISGPKLASAMANQGGIGFVGTGGQNEFTKIMHFCPVGQISKSILDAKALTENKKQIGVGFLTQGQLDKDPTILDQVIPLHPCNIWVFGEHFENYVKIIKNYHEYPSNNVFVQVSSIDDAIKAGKLGVDVVVIRGNNAGGPSNNTQSPLYQMPFSQSLPIVTKALKEECASMPLIAVAGGISTGKDVAECLKAGADAIVFGTKLAFTNESDLSEQEKFQIANSMHIGTTMMRKNPDESLVMFSQQDKKSARGLILPLSEVIANIVEDTLHHSK